VRNGTEAAEIMVTDTAFPGVDVPEIDLDMDEMDETIVKLPTGPKLSKGPGPLTGGEAAPCTDCGSALLPKSKFCTECGARTRLGAAKATIKGGGGGGKGKGNEHPDTPQVGSGVGGQADKFGGSGMGVLGEDEDEEGAAGVGGSSPVTLIAPEDIVDLVSSPLNGVLGVLEAFSKQCLCGCQSEWPLKEKKKADPRVADNESTSPRALSGCGGAMGGP
jgi:hypothetical protein